MVTGPFTEKIDCSVAVTTALENIVLHKDIEVMANRFISKAQVLCESMSASRTCLHCRDGP